MSADLSKSLLGQITLVNELISARLEPAMKRAGLNVGTFELLSAVKGGGGRLSQIELAERLGITAPSLCEAAQAAARRGLVEQVASESDRRKKRIVLTSDGERAVSEVLAAFRELSEELERSLSVKETDSSLRTLGKVAVMLDKGLA